MQGVFRTAGVGFCVRVAAIFRNTKCYHLSAPRGVTSGPRLRGGRHLTGTLGSVAAAVAGGKLLNLDAQRLTHALGIGATQAAGMQQNRRTQCLYSAAVALIDGAARIPQYRDARALDPAVIALRRKVGARDRPRRQGAGPGVGAEARGRHAGAGGPARLTWLAGTTREYSSDPSVAWDEDRRLRTLSLCRHSRASGNPVLVLDSGRVALGLLRRHARSGARLSP